MMTTLSSPPPPPGALSAVPSAVPRARVRVVIAKPGLDGHDRGAKVVARALRDAGHEVIYTGLHQSPAQIVAAVIQEDASVVGLSVLSGAHLTATKDVISLLRQEGAGDVRVLVGGIIPAADIPVLREMGVHAVFTPGADLKSIIELVEQASAEQAGAEQAVGTERA
jgi:methylmalonyl-CoA mutase C-terminal domain/subunit